MRQSTSGLPVIAILKTAKIFSPALLMALLSEEREKASEARQRRFTKNLFDAKTVFPFRASGTSVVSPLATHRLRTVPTLHNLKEAPVIRTVDPFTGADLCKHRVAEHRDGGSSFNTIRPLLRQPDGLNLHHAAILPASLYWLTPSAPFTLRAAACKDSRLCCRVAVKLHQTINFQTLHQSSASL